MSTTDDLDILIIVAGLNYNNNWMGTTSNNDACRFSSPAIMKFSVVEIIIQSAKVARRVNLLR